MSKVKKLTLAGLVAACSLGLVMKVAWATPGSLISTTILAGPAQMGELNVHTHNDLYDSAVKIKTKGESDVYTVYNAIQPGGHTGWHSHPGPSIITVKSGVATEYHADDLAHPEVHAAGTSFVDDGEGAHLLRNEGTTLLETIAFQILPAGAPRRNDEPAP